MNNERFAVPEILFHPSDISIQEQGLSEAIVHVINNCPAGRLSIEGAFLSMFRVLSKQYPFRGFQLNNVLYKGNGNFWLDRHSGHSV